MHMQDSAGIKRQNKALIRKLLIQGEACSKQQIAGKTGLSVASCNTYLNEMEETGEVIGEKRKLHDVGRTSVVYRLNEEYESIVCLYFELIQGVKSLTAAVLSPTGKARQFTVTPFDTLDLHAITGELEKVLAQFPNVSQIVVGTPSIAENGIIRHSDIPELEGTRLVQILEERYKLPVFLANDMYYKVYGYSQKEQLSGQVITLVNYPAGVLPGTATVCNGVVLTGRNLFAGMVGFLDYGMSREEQLCRLQDRSTAGPLIHRAVIALISILNPHKLLFTGDLIRKEDLPVIRAACETCIPEEYLPDFAYLADITPCYLAGMYWTAINRKVENL